MIAQSPGKSPHGRAVESLRTCHLTIERQSSWIIPQSSGFGAFSAAKAPASEYADGPENDCSGHEGAAKGEVLPLSPGRAERHGFEYYRHGTLSLYRALNTKNRRGAG